ncbi:MAG: RluA family pseudouridine synthase [Verrucomicrobiota bacterium]
MSKPSYIELANDVRIPILYEDRAVLAIDKPYGWMLVPQSWDKTNRNLQLAIRSSINAGDFWARCRGITYLRFIHRLDAETTGVLLFAKNPGAMRTYSALFANRRIEKVYLAVVHGQPPEREWDCCLKLTADPGLTGKVEVDLRSGIAAETFFRVLATRAERALIEARPVTGRTHQIRVHLAASGHPILGDPLYSLRAKSRAGDARQLALRAASLTYLDPFQRRPVKIDASVEEFKKKFGFSSEATA